MNEKLELLQRPADALCSPTVLSVAEVEQVSGGYYPGEFTGIVTMMQMGFGIDAWGRGYEPFQMVY